MMEWAQWTGFLMPILGGVLIGLSASALMLFSGRIAGISGIFAGLLTVRPGDAGWRLAFVLGLASGGALLYAIQPSLFDFGVRRSLVVVAAGGLLVGFGSRLGSGCTSGHGICGAARLGPRSLVATVTFIASGALTVWVVNNLAGGAI